MPAYPGYRCRGSGRNFAARFTIHESHGVVASATTCPSPARSRDPTFYGLLDSVDRIGSRCTISVSRLVSKEHFSLEQRTGTSILIQEQAEPSIARSSAANRFLAISALIRKLRLELSARHGQKARDATERREREREREREKEEHQRGSPTNGRAEGEGAEARREEDRRVYPRILTHDARGVY